MVQKLLPLIHLQRVQRYHKRHQKPRVILSVILHYPRCGSCLLKSRVVQNLTLQAQPKQDEQRSYHVLPLSNATKWSPIKEHPFHSLKNLYQPLISVLKKMVSLFYPGTISQDISIYWISVVLDKFRQVEFSANTCVFNVTFFFT